MAKKRKQKYLTSENHPPYREFPENQYGLGDSLKSAFGAKGSAWGAVSGLAGGLANSAISGGMESGAGNVIGSVGKLASAIPGPWGAVACLTENQVVMTSKGVLKKIKDLLPEDGIMGYNAETHKAAPQTITIEYRKLYKECVKITLQSGVTLECSIDHPIYVANSGRAKRSYIDGFRTRTKEYNYVNAGDLSVNQYAGIIDEIPVFGDYHEDNAYSLGMLIGDGSYGEKSCVMLHTGDKSTWDYLENNNLAELKYKYVPEEQLKYNKEFRVYKFPKWQNLLRSYGIYGQTKLAKTFPNNIDLWDKESLCNLIAGLWDTDGYVTIESSSNRYRICFCQSNLPLLEHLRWLLLKLGIHTSLKVNASKKKIYKGRNINSKESYVLIIKDKKSAKRFIDNIPINIDYKQANLDRINILIRDKVARDNSYRVGVHPDKIIKIENIGRQRIYNLWAHQDNNYIANGIITHNSVGLQAVGGLVNRAFGSKLNQENINAANQNISQLNNFKSDAGSFDELSSNISSQPVTLGFDQSFIGKDGWFSHKARNKFRELKAKQESARAFVQDSITNNADNLDTTQDQSLLANFSAFGGSLDTQGGSFPLGYIEVNKGGTHEQNPNEGVQMGVDSQGVPNLVEEGEVIYDDYVFSNRLTVPKDMRKKYKLKDNITFADAFKRLSEEAEERPNDPISRRGLGVIMNNLRQSQEEVRQAKQAKSLKRKLAKMSPEEQEALMAQMQGGQEEMNIPQDEAMMPQEEMLPQQPMMSYGGKFHAHGGRLANHLDGDEVSQYLTGNFGTTPTQPQQTYWGYTKVDPNLNNVTVPLAPTDKSQDYTFKSFFEAANEAGYKGYPEGPLWSGAQQVMGKDYRNPSAPIYVDRQGQQVKTKPTATRTIVDTDIDTDTGNPTDTAPTWLRYAPVVGSALGLFQNVLSKPDYSGAKSLEGYANSLGTYTPIKATPIGDYMTYRPLDRQYAINLLNANAGATRRNVINTSGGNRGQAMAGILAADYNAGNNIGNLFRQAEESNQAQRERVATFNRGTNQFNAQQELTAAQANQQAQLKARASMAGLYGQAAQMRDAVNAQRNAGISANLTNLFNSLGAIGKENMARNMVMTNPALYYSIGANGAVSYKNGYDDLSESEKSQVRAAARKAASKKKAKGGYLTIKKGGRHG